jgi:hypothetical protein
MALSFAEKVLKSKRPVVLFHTWTVTRELLRQAIHEKRSMDLDVCIDDQGHPYLGHSKEYHEKTHEPFFDSMPLWEAVEALADSNIPVIVDCKHFGAWPVVEDVVRQLRPERCLVHSFVSELKFEAGRMPGERDFVSEWSSIERLRAMKRKFASVTTTASAKWLPEDVLVSKKYEGLLEDIITLLKESAVDTVCLNVSDSTLSDMALRRFLKQDILPHVGVDRIDAKQFSEMYVGETDRLEFASRIVNRRSSRRKKQLSRGRPIFRGGG